MPEDFEKKAEEWLSANVPILTARSEKMAAGVDDWVQLWDEENAYSYFYNEKSGESSWDMPEGWAELNPINRDDWLEQKDEDTGSTFWQHKTTGEAVLEEPWAEQDRQRERRKQEAAAAAARRAAEAEELRKKMEVERIRREVEAEEERKRLEREAEEEKERLQREAEEERIRKERMRREAEEKAKRVRFGQSEVSYRNRIETHKTLLARARRCAPPRARGAGWEVENQTAMKAFVFSRKSGHLGRQSLACVHLRDGKWRIKQL